MVLVVVVAVVVVVVGAAVVVVVVVGAAVVVVVDDVVVLGGGFVGRPNISVMPHSIFIGRSTGAEYAMKEIVGVHSTTLCNTVRVCICV